MIETISRDRLVDLLEAGADKRIAIIGDAMLDVYLRGDVDRISPEAPVPVVRVRDRELALGGAANVAQNVDAIGARVDLVCAVGDDAEGQVVNEMLRAIRSDQRSVVTVARRTRTQTRVLARSQQVVRSDEEEDADITGDEVISLVRAALDAIAQADAVVLEDYNKGVLTPAVIAPVMQDAGAKDIPIVVDPKYRNFFAYKSATIFKTKRRELESARGAALGIWHTQDLSSSVIGATAFAQDTVPSPFPIEGPDVDAVVITNGIELTPDRDSVIRAANPSCPLTPSQVNAVRAGVGSAFVGGNAYLYHYFKKAWWSGTRAKHFFFHADWDQWFRDQDKFGHMFGGYHLARIGYAGLREACVSDKKAIIWSAAYAAAFQLQIEIFDGQFQKYGFSYADMIANTTGQTLAVMQELHPSWRAIKPTFSYHKTRALTNTEAGLIPGELRPSLDYSGQTYWFSADMEQLLPAEAKQYWPSFVRVSVGHSVTDWINPETAAAQRGKRKILLSLDFDADKLPGNAPLWRSIKRTLSYYHFPAPALELTPRLHLSPWYR